MQHLWITATNCDKSLIKRERVQDFVIRLAKLLEVERINDCIFGANDKEDILFMQFTNEAYFSGICRIEDAEIDLVIASNRLTSREDITELLNDIFYITTI